ncbi:RsmB/NOP family class I SAM-dependent RNA methyltransferase [Caulobacter sp. 17J80-11]|uniref:RsmB/NOP family class I SAM-dependent RNA methyltransferase n=1 Tax=Caulobacter sp. 17J80-11 TaxID=2763502 RepID=UPI0016535B4B|nr:RsmB/NOP family class I SAM-dependent RNA methyltransferase [Caulobacter sp. 17J80-11]MBC6982023.1 RsmB/NOP family class I SAM-dependent RNA methyltransferase [Caulobacter sp. 17J80-11]
MTPAARLAAAAEVLDQIARSRAPAEGALKAWGQTHRFAGSKDRRAIADRVYRCIRAKARLSWAMGASNGRALVIGSLALIDGVPLEEIDALYTGEGYAPAALTAEERARLEARPGEPPAWVAAGLPAFAADSFREVYGDAWADEAEALMRPRAPIDLRVNGERASVEAVKAELEGEGLAPERTPFSAWGLRLTAEPPPNVQKLEAFQAGHIEIQDEGSQLAAWLADAHPGWTVVDYCAGGGGKTLALAQSMAGSGGLIACDVEQKRLDNIRPRLNRAGVTAELRKLGLEGGGMADLENSAELVLADAPCSGSGTWRRRPEDAWRLTEEEVDRLHALQVVILGRAAKLVRLGGRLAYVTCSMLKRENEDSCDAFEAAHPNFRPVSIETALNTPNLTDAARARLASLANGSHRLRLSPRATGTDGFFIALYERTA